MKNLVTFVLKKNSPQGSQRKHKEREIKMTSKYKLSASDNTHSVLSEKLSDLCVKKEFTTRLTKETQGALGKRNKNDR